MVSFRNSKSSLHFKKSFLTTLKHVKFSPAEGKHRWIFVCTKLPVPWQHLACLLRNCCPDSQVLKFISQVSQVCCALDQGKLALRYSKAFAIGFARPYLQLELHLICLHHTDTKGLPASVLLTGTSIYSSFETLCPAGKVLFKLHRFMLHRAE